MFRKGNSFTLGAEFTAAWYCAFRTTPFGATLSNGQLLYATALVCSEPQLISGSISKSDLEIGVLSALGGFLNYFFYKKQIYDYYDRAADYCSLVCLAMLLQVFIICEDATLDSYRVVDLIATKKDLIEKSVRRIIANPKKNKHYSTIASSARVIILNPSFQSDVLSFEE